MMSDPKADFSTRDAKAGVDPLFVTRWSPRAYGAEAVPRGDMEIMLDAARWSPSAYNEQPWRFYTSTPASYDQFLGLLVDANQRWAASAPVIGFVVASRHFARNDKHNPHAVFDTGSAWMAFNLQASQLGYHVHGMAGIHYERVYEVLGLDPDQFEVICGFALGRVNGDAGEAITPRRELEVMWFEVG